MKIILSVIIPVYNDQQGINSCLNFLSKQKTDFNFEVIVIDNISEKKIFIENTYSNFARVVTCEKQGSYSARNVGINNAKGEILAFTDADCMPREDWLNNGLHSILKNNKKCILGGEVNIQLQKNPSSVALYQKTVGFRQKENIEKRNFSATANLFATKEQFKKVGLFNENLLSGGDREWCWRALKCGYTVKYAGEAIVDTLPRNSLRDAIRQARRIAGGRFFLRQQKKEIPYISSGIRRHFSPWDSFLWLIKCPELSGVNRVKVLGVAMILRVAHSVETLRLHFFGQPERR